MADLGQSDPCLSRWERFRLDDGEGGMREVTVDVRGALTDALLGYDVPASKVVEEFFRLVMNPNYEVKS